MSGSATRATTRIGFAFALGAALLFGASTPFAKALLGEVSPWLMAGLLYLGAGIGLWLFRLIARRRRQTEAPMRRGDLPWLAAVVFFGGVAGPVLLMLGLADATAATASLLLNAEALATLAIAWIFFRESVDLRVGMGAAAILAGAVVLVWDGGAVGIGPGALAILGACLCWGIDNNLTRKLSAAEPAQIAMVKGLVAGVANMAIAFAQGDSMPAPGPAGQALLVGFFGYGVSLALFIYGLRHLGAARTGAVFSIAPFVGAALAVLAFGEDVTLRLAGAAVLMGLGLYLHVSERHEHEHVHEALAHAHRHVHDAHHQHEHSADDPPGEPHAHAHRHRPLRHRHPHYPDLHHRHRH